MQDKGTVDSEGIMPKDRPVTPESVLSKSDLGDDTQRRFRYQAAYAAIMSLGLLDEESGIDKLFCEHHEDILIKKFDNKFIGVQVKTRDVGIEPFKASEPQIINSLARFVQLEADFPGHFLKFVLATNCGFWHRDRNKNNLPYLLEVARDAKTAGPGVSSSQLSSYVKKLCDAGESNPDFVVNVLKKVELLDNLPKLEDIELRLAQHIAGIPGIGDPRWDELKQAATTLTDRMFRAASLTLDPPEKYYFAILDDPSKQKENAAIQGKLITKETVQSIIKKSLRTEIPLRRLQHVPLSDLPKGMRGLELKMAAGGVSVSNINLMKDYKYSVEYLVNIWLIRYGKGVADEWYEHLLTIVRTECQEAHDSARTIKGLSGRKMLDLVRRNLRRRYSNEKNSLFGCKYEHLLGFAGILTEECNIWWSKEFKTSEGIGL